MEAEAVSWYQPAGSLRWTCRAHEEPLCSECAQIEDWTRTAKAKRMAAELDMEFDPDDEVTSSVHVVHGRESLSEVGEATEEGLACPNC
jgi:hypothetical protein